MRERLAGDPLRTHDTPRGCESGGILLSVYQQIANAAASSISFPPFRNGGPYGCRCRRRSATGPLR